jgi:hypothetical protein
MRYFFAPVCVGIDKFSDINLDPRLLITEMRSCFQSLCHTVALHNLSRAHEFEVQWLSSPQPPQSQHTFPFWLANMWQTQDMWLCRNKAKLGVKPDTQQMAVRCTFLQLLFGGREVTAPHCRPCRALHILTQQHTHAQRQLGRVALGRLMTWFIQSHSTPLPSTAKQAEEKKASSNTNRYTLV